MTSNKLVIHEVDFCGQVASTVNILISQAPTDFPFQEARVEGFGSGAARLKRKDLRFFDRNKKLILCGEVKLPGTPEGRSPYDAKLCADAETKANNAGIRYFFTWNINTFVLWDRSLWDKPLLDRRVWERRLSRYLAAPEDVAQEDNLSFIKTKFLPDLLHELSDIISGRRRDWSMPPDDIFIRSLESHLDWPVQLTSAYILEHANNKSFDLRVQGWMSEQDWTFVRTPHEEWVKAVVNMAKTLAYVWSNRLIFYKALRARFTDLPRLELRSSVKKPEEALTVLNRFFQKAVERSGDYEPLLIPDAKDWATELVFHPSGALEAWRGLLKGIESIDFKEVSSDVVGRIFQKLIGPEERHRYGQHFTGDDVVDLINSFCIRNAEDTILDPACGSGSFLVRAYYRKRHLDPAHPHINLIGELFGCDIALYPAHLATLNLAAREINEEANYPRVVRRNFFDFNPQQPFCYIPDNAGSNLPVLLPTLDAIVGNPPYVRQEKIEKADKARFGQIFSEAWPGLQLTGRSDLHCYFWPAATRLLKDDGYFGFLTSSSWLDVEYGFALQGWLLNHFRILAVMESSVEPWFEDARVKTCVTIIQRCNDEAIRMANLVRFVRFNRKLADIVRTPPGQDEEDRQVAFERLRERILTANDDYQDQNLRVIVKTQKDLWADGVRAGRILSDVKDVVESEDEYNDDELDKEDVELLNEEPQTVIFEHTPDTYRAGKWGRYLRAPDIYFDIMRNFNDRFVPLGEVTRIRRGITSGCDAFFMPKDMTTDMLTKHKGDKVFREQTGGASRKDAVSGKIKIIQAGDGSIHPIESKYLAPEVHSLMKIDRPVLHSDELDRVVLLVDEPMNELKAKAPWVWRYLRYGMTATFASAKSKGKPVPERSTCQARALWYDLTGLAKSGFAFWPKSQQYRHIVPSNPENIICNCNLYDVASDGLTDRERVALVAILNSTLVGLFKTFYGRFAGTEGNLKTEVVDVNLLEIPDPRGVPSGLAVRLSNALEKMNKREVGRLVEEQLMECHSPDRARRIAERPLVLSNELQQMDRHDLDNAVFELLGVSDPKEREILVVRLYEATAQHFRDIRLVEIEKMQQRSKSSNRRLSIHDLAADIWDAVEIDDKTPLVEWIEQSSNAGLVIVIPEERPVVFKDSPLFDEYMVQFGKEGKIRLNCQSYEQAKLIVWLANIGVSGEINLPGNHQEYLNLLDRLKARFDDANTRFNRLVESRTSDDRMRGQLSEILERWFVLGRKGLS